MAEDQDQDKLAEEWAKALAQENEDAGQDEAALAEAWSAALKEEQSGDSDQALADEWAKALADEEETKIKKEHKKKQLAAQSRNFEYQDLTAEAKSPQTGSIRKDLDFILDIPLDVSAQLGSTRLLINDLLQLGQGSVIELDKLAGEPLEILVNGKLVARGETVVVNEKFGVRLTDIISPVDRVKQLG
jgi:flagellar motor switch protein FliN/FliY